MIGLGSLNMAGCPQKAPGAPDLSFKAKIFAADSKTQTIVRNNVFISCSLPVFDEFVCTTRDELKAHLKELTELSWKCEKWKD